VGGDDLRLAIVVDIGDNDPGQVRPTPLAPGSLVSWPEAARQISAPVAPATTLML
jgi:hypothetical protein